MKRKLVGTRLPTFTQNDSKELIGSLNFIGINHYATVYVQDTPRYLDKHGNDYIQDLSVSTSCKSIVNYFIH
ncbi:hypothetical protein GIB67_016259 [Kingdonia uniflora]|uniref:Beta-glucosidase n=1 Tax=Kingdonia uniflora TaxID=39325 RepID=A0A7J7M984_9MAGN|nr:hypothetical protein GIB67_016259 [Kingdonia uniflora]